MRLHAPIIRLANPLIFWTGTLIGAVITSCQSKAYFSSGSFTAELRSLDSAFEEAISDLSGLKISLIL